MLCSEKTPASTCVWFGVGNFEDQASESLKLFVIDSYEGFESFDVFCRDVFLSEEEAEDLVGRENSLLFGLG